MKGQLDLSMNQDPRIAATRVSRASSAEIPGTGAANGDMLLAVAIPVGQHFALLSIAFGNNGTYLGHNHIMGISATPDVAGLAASANTIQMIVPVNGSIVEFGHPIFYYNNTTAAVQYFVLALAGLFGGAASNAATEFGQATIHYLLEA